MEGGLQCHRNVQTWHCIKHGAKFIAISRKELVAVTKSSRYEPLDKTFADPSYGFPQSQLRHEPYPRRHFWVVVEPLHLCSLIRGSLLI